ncbi:hypothetical protein LguiB_009642 [Lonicera macranthoides]
MLSRNYESNTVTYTTLIDGHCKKSELDEVNKLFDEMVIQNCEPSTVTYTTLIHGYCEKGQLN